MYLGNFVGVGDRLNSASKSLEVAERRYFHCIENEVYMKDFFCKCDQICSFLRIWPHLLKKSFKSGSHLLKNCFICFNENALKMMKKAFFLFKIFQLLSWLIGHVEKKAWFERRRWIEVLWRHNLVNKQLQYTYCSISHEAKATISTL